MPQWYTFTTLPGASTSDPNNYSNPQTLQPSCPGSVKLCAILADDNGFGFPDITSAIITDIANAVNSGNDNGRAILRD
ncbi:hypothetical protein QG516_07710 [Pedobacter gandavensis]|uniref:hypothetical protein n=1 Tax=Pedobacter gandavensis TaxID=2679963 RepID=UPI0024795ABA|nr:hypothetical protein [Pedobacter gandavensis]WGQ11540.1 hypothetical protein QG516_07710 [Pedobacter gandavensis]